MLQELLVKFLLSNCDSHFASCQYKSSFLSSLCSLVIPTQWDKARGIDLECLGACVVRENLVKAGYMILTWCNVNIYFKTNIQQALFLFSSCCSTLLSVGNTLHSSSPSWVCCTPGGSWWYGWVHTWQLPMANQHHWGFLRHLYKVLVSKWDATNWECLGYATLKREI